MHTSPGRSAFTRAFVMAVALAIGEGYALAEAAGSPQPRAGAGVPSAEAATKDAHDLAVASCVQMWDRGTHMTEQQWLRTCKRVQNRLQYLEVK